MRKRDIVATDECMKFTSPVTFKLKLTMSLDLMFSLQETQEIEKTIRQIQVVRYPIRQLCLDSLKVNIMKKKKVKVLF